MSTYALGSPASGDRLTHETVIALVPAHEEEELIGHTLSSLFAQDHALAGVVVAADNCSDRTVEVARDFGADAFETVANKTRKAGALNQALRIVLPTLEDEDFVLIMDADSRLRDDFVTNALVTFRDPQVGAVSVACRTVEEPGLLRLLQAIEYARCRRMVSRRGAHTLVMSGAATMIRVKVLREVAFRRGSLLPGHPGSFYLEDSLTEDYELTVALNRLGLQTKQPKHCVGWTDTMPTLAMLWQQRLRWQRGTLETLARYRWTPQTSRMWIYVVFGYISSLTPLLFGLALWLSWQISGRIEWQPLWLAPALLVVLERAVTARDAGRKAVAIALFVAIEWFYDAFRGLVYWHALGATVIRTAPRWQASRCGRRQSLADT